MAPLRTTPKGLFLDVKATPKAARAEVAGIRNGALLVKVTAAPEKGKANAAVAALLAKEMGIPKSAFELVTGDTDRNKSFRLVSHAEAVQSWLEGLRGRLHQE
ncbi:MAG: DUF167 domain-containing protein [Phyllobacteriaceae bacterium]|nr:DUF167 domain-containing protein [Phyllobacteriaceae bacterium]